MADKPDWLKQAEGRGLIGNTASVNHLAFTQGEPASPEVAKTLYAHSEADFQRAVVHFAQTYGWRVAHFRKVPVKHGERTHWETPVAADGKGFPDLLMLNAKRRECIVAELKLDTNKPTREQVQWLTDFAEVFAEGFNVHVGVWRPEDWEKVVRIIAGTRGSHEASAEMSRATHEELQRLADDGNPHCGE